jgi:hypothetical protein
MEEFFKNGKKKEKHKRRLSKKMGEANGNF